MGGIVRTMGKVGFHPKEAGAEYYDDERRLHRDGGPAAYEVHDGTGILIREKWCQHGRLHNAHGPAYVERDPNTRETIVALWYNHGELHYPQPDCAMWPESVFIGTDKPDSQAVVVDAVERAESWTMRGQYPS